MNLLVTLSDIGHLQDLKEARVDGVIVGVKGYANNFNRTFDLSEVRLIALKAKALCLQVFACINVIIDESELKEVEQIVYNIKQMNLDGLYFNDLAVLHLAKKYQISNLRFDPDTLITNSADIQVFKSMGISNVVLSKDLSYQEILDIASYTGKLDMQIHGYFNLSTSKRKFLTNYFRFLNKEVDVRARDLWLKEESRDYLLPIEENERGTCIYSDYVLQTLELMDQLEPVIDNGIINDYRMSFDEVLDTIPCYNKQQSLSKENIIKYLKTRYGHEFSEGFLMQKTVKKKEELND